MCQGACMACYNRDPEDIDYVWNVTAHEVAHQRWAHQVIGADVLGATLLSETLAEYSGLMVWEKRYGSEKCASISITSATPICERAATMRPASCRSRRFGPL